MIKKINFLIKNSMDLIFLPILSKFLVSKLLPGAYDLQTAIIHHKITKKIQIFFFYPSKQAKISNSKKCECNRIPSKGKIDCS